MFVGILPANIHHCGELVLPQMAREWIRDKRASHYFSILWCLLCEYVPGDLENSICNLNGCDSDVISIFQQCYRPAWSYRILAIDSLFSGRDVHFTGKDSQVFGHLDVVTSSELDLLYRNASCCCWFHSRPR